MRIANVNRSSTEFKINGVPGIGVVTVNCENNNQYCNIPLELLDPDLTNDQYTYSVLSGARKIFGSNWRINPVALGCNPGYSQANLNVTLQTSDGRGSIIRRNLLVHVNNAQLGSNAVTCPY